MDLRDLRVDVFVWHLFRVYFTFSLVINCRLRCFPLVISLPQNYRTKYSIFGNDVPIFYYPTPPTAMSFLMSKNTTSVLILFL